MIDVQARLCTWFCRTVERTTCLLVGHPVVYRGQFRVCARCGKDLPW